MNRKPRLVQNLITVLVMTICAITATACQPQTAATRVVPTPITIAVSPTPEPRPTAVQIRQSPTTTPPVDEPTSASSPKRRPEATKVQSTEALPPRKPVPRLVTPPTTGDPEEEPPPPTRTAPQPTPDTTRPANIYEYSFGYAVSQEKPEAAEYLLSLPWVTDGLDDIESQRFQILVIVAGDHPGDPMPLLTSGWIWDGVDAAEEEMVLSLFSIAQDDLPRGERLVRMPFLSTIESFDLAALTALDHLAHSYLSAFRQIMDHPNYHNGITDEQAKVIAVMDGVQRVNPQILPALIDPDRTLVTERKILTEYSGLVDLAVIRVGKEVSTNSDIMDLLDQSVRVASGLTQRPLQRKYVPLFFGDSSPGGSSGSNHYTHIVVRPEYDVPKESPLYEKAHTIIAHETAHFYWNGNEIWLDEGAAEFTATIARQHRTGRDLTTSSRPCNSAAQIKDLPARRTDCHYRLGEEHFLELYQAMNPFDFYHSFGTLYERSITRDPELDYQYPRLGIRHVWDIFGANSSGKREQVERIVRQWYGVTPD